MTWVINVVIKLVPGHKVKMTISYNRIRKIMGVNLGLQRLVDTHPLTFIS